MIPFRAARAATASPAAAKISRERNAAEFPGSFPPWLQPVRTRHRFPRDHRHYDRVFPMLHNTFSIMQKKMTGFYFDPVIFSLSMSVRSRAVRKGQQRPAQGTAERLSLALFRRGPFAGLIALIREIQQTVKPDLKPVIIQMIPSVGRKRRRQIAVAVLER